MFSDYMFIVKTLHRIEKIRHSEKSDKFVDTGIDIDHWD